LRTYPAIQFIAPFLVFIVLLGVRGLIPLAVEWQYPIQVLLTTSVLLVTSTATANGAYRIYDRPKYLVGSFIVGIMVFEILCGSDLILPTYRIHWLFENFLTGASKSSLAVASRTNVVFLVFRVIGTAVLVPVIEELFWRGWLMRYLINS